MCSCSAHRQLQNLTSYSMNRQAPVGSPPYGRGGQGDRRRDQSTGGLRLPEPREIAVPVQVRRMWPARRGGMNGSRSWLVARVVAAAWDAGRVRARLLVAFWSADSTARPGPLACHEPRPTGSAPARPAACRFSARLLGELRVRPPWSLDEDRTRGLQRAP